MAKIRFAKGTVMEPHLIIFDAAVALVARNASPVIVNGTGIELLTNVTLEAKDCFFGVFLFALIRPNGYRNSIIHKVNRWL